jgi:hypothetical protein
MTAWEVLPRGVGWKSPPLLSFRASRAALEQRLGPPPIVNADSNGIGPFDAWALRFRCGLEVCLWIFHCRADDFSTIDDPNELAVIEVHASAAHERHILFHLPVPANDVARWKPSPFVPEPLVWRLLRQDDNGVQFEIARYPSRCEALSAAARFEAQHHKQMYWVEEDRLAGLSPVAG